VRSLIPLLKDPIDVERLSGKSKVLDQQSKTNIVALEEEVKESEPKANNKLIELK
jgi:hypothetical protein